MGETGLLLVVADLVIAGSTLFTTTAGADERNRHPIAHAPARHGVTDRLHNTGQFVAWNVGQADAVIMAHPAVPVTPAQAGCLHTDYRAGGRHFRRRNLGD